MIIFIYCNILRYPFFVLPYVSQGLVESLEGESLALDPNICVIALYDNEEVS